MSGSPAASAGRVLMAVRRRNQEGFTLTEVLMTAVIIGILAAMAFPNYRRTVETGYRREAQDLLMTAYNGERAYSFANNGLYYDVNEGLPLDWRTIYMDDPNLASIPVQFTVVTGGGGTTFTVTARRSAGCTATIDENRNLVMSAGWNTPATC